MKVQKQRPGDLHGGFFKAPGRCFCTFIGGLSTIPSYGIEVARQTEKLLTTRADAAKAALAASVAARDANAAREIMGRSFADLHLLADAVELLNERLGGLSDQRKLISEMRERIAALEIRVEELEESTKRKKK